MDAYVDERLNTKTYVVQIKYNIVFKMISNKRYTETNPYIYLPTPKEK